MEPNRDELWQKYPELRQLWSDYIRQCKNPSSMEDVSRAFNEYRYAYLERKGRYQIIPAIAAGVAS